MKKGKTKSNDEEGKDGEEKDSLKENTDRKKDKLNKSGEESNDRKKDKARRSRSQQKNSKQSEKDDESKNSDLSDRPKKGKADDESSRSSKDSRRSRQQEKKRNQANESQKNEQHQPAHATTFQKFLSGWSPVNQSIVDRDGDSACCYTGMSEDLLDEQMCFSRDECSWICCRSEKLGGFSYNTQWLLCSPLIVSKHFSSSCLECCLLTISDIPCISMFGFGLKKPSPPQNQNSLDQTRSLLKKQNKELEDDVCLIQVLGCDRPLLERISVLHPMVRVHAVNITTGQYIKRHGQDESHDGATTTYESSSLFSHRDQDQRGGDEDSIDTGDLDSSTSIKYNEPCDMVLPVSTGQFPLGRCMEPPRWEGASGDLVINEPYHTILDPETLLLVEVCDIASAGVNARKVSGCDNGFVGIAWGFLLPVSRQGRACIGMRGGSIHDEGLGATPRDFRKSQNTQSSSLYPDAELESKRLTLQLFHWNQNIDPIALTQAKHRGILPLTPPARSKVPSVYLQWYMRQRRVYPVTLALRIGPISRPRSQTVEHRPTNCMQVEIGHKTKEQHLGLIDEGDDTEPSEEEEESRAQFNRTSGKHHVSEAVARRLWTPNTKCSLPNKLLLRKSVGREGATALKYSHCGRWLAVACVSGGPSKWPILVFDLHEEDGTAKQCCSLPGHVSLVHDLDWSLDDRFLVSASSDGSAIVWSLENVTDKRRRRRSQPVDTSMEGAPASTANSPTPNTPNSPSLAPTSANGTTKHKGAYAVRVLHPSPCILYAARFLPRTRTDTTSLSPVASSDPCPLVITGSFDGSVVLWDPCKEKPNMGFLGGYQTALHRFSVTALVIEARNRRVFSGDSDGIIWAWVLGSSNKQSSKHSTPSKQGASEEVTFRPESRPINHASLRGHTITSLEVEPSKSQRKGCSNLLVAAHGNLVLLFDSEAKALLAQYHGASLHTSPIHARFSPDGRFVVSGSEDGRVVVWKASTSDSSGRVEDITSPITSHSKKSCTLGGMGFNAPLLDVAWNPKQHCVAMIASGGNFPLLVAYTDTPVQKPLNDPNETVLVTLPPPMPDQTHNFAQSRRDSFMSGILSTSLGAPPGEPETRSKQAMRTLAKARLSELRARKYQSEDLPALPALSSPSKKMSLLRGNSELFGRTDSDVTSEEQPQLPKAIDPVTF